MKCSNRTIVGLKAFVAASVLLEHLGSNRTIVGLKEFVE